MATGPNIESFRFDLGVRNTEEFEVQPFGQAPALVKSVNTRLGIVDGSVVKSPRHAAHGTTVGDERRAGVVPSGNGSAIIFAKKANERVTSAGHAQTLVSPLGTGATRQNDFYPYDVSNYGTVPGARTFASPATVTDSNGNQWFVSVRDDAAGTGSLVIACAVTASGEVALTPTAIAALAGVKPNARPWVGITRTGNTGYVCVWYLDGGAIKVREVTINAATLSAVIGSPATVYTPVSAPAGSIAVHSDNDSGFAWLVSRNSALATSVTISKVTISAWTLASTTIALGANADHCAIRQLTIGSTKYLVVGVSKASGGMSGYLLDANAMTTTWSVVGPTAAGAIGVSFYRDTTSGAFNFVIVGTHATGGPPSPLSSTTVQHYAVSTGSTVGATVLPWKGIISNAAWDRDSSDNIAPLFAAQNCYSIFQSADPGLANWCADPAVEIYRSNAPDTCSMVARYAVDTALIYPGLASNDATVVNSGNLESSAAGFTIAYLEDTALKGNEPNPGYVSKFLTLSTALVPPAYVIDAEGLAIVAQGPVYWDGMEVAEWAPTSIPIITTEVNAGNLVMGAGTFKLTAVVLWPDATGKMHRSQPAAVVTLTPGVSDKPRIRVTLPTTMRNGYGQERVQVILYCSQTGQSTTYAQSWQPTAWTTGYVEFADITAPLQNALTPAAYTDNGPASVLPAQCPPSFEDVALVGDRLWGLSLGELWYSKSREPGICFEFNSLQTLPIPAAAGRAHAIEESRGSLVVLCERGAWIVTGLGPDAALGGSPFNPPEQISELPCLSRHGVVRTPAGIFFVSGDRFAVIGGPTGAQYLEDFDTRQGLFAPFSSTARPAVLSYRAVHLADTREVIWYCGTTLSSSFAHAVYNYKLGRFTTWDSATMAAVRDAALDPVTGHVFLVAATGELAQMDHDSYSDAAMVFRAGAINLNGEEGDCVVQMVRLRARRDAAHAVSLTLYEEGAPTVEAFDPAQVANATHASNSEYLLEKSASGTMQAMGVEVSFAGNGNCVRPVAVTLVYSAKSGTISAVKPDGRR